MEPPFPHSSVFITGGAKRIGAESVQFLASLGYDVIFQYNTASEYAKNLCEICDNLGLSVHAIQANLMGTHHFDQLIAHAESLAKFPLTLLIHNAAVFVADTLDTLTQETWSNNMNLNAKTPLFLTQSFVRSLSGRSAHVIMILDQRVLRPTGHFLSYTASKMTLYGLTKTLAISLAERGVRVNGIAPGLTLKNDTDLDANFEDKQKKLRLNVPPKPDDITRAIQFLIATPSITGCVIPIDSGEHL